MKLYRHRDKSAYYLVDNNITKAKKLYDFTYNIQRYPFRWYELGETDMDSLNYEFEEIALKQLPIEAFNNLTNLEYLELKDNVKTI